MGTYAEKIRGPVQVPCLRCPADAKAVTDGGMQLCCNCLADFGYVWNLMEKKYQKLDNKAGRRTSDNDARSNLVDALASTKRAMDILAAGQLWEDAEYVYGYIGHIIRVIDRGNDDIARRE
jgi:hypothetical protein